MKIFLPWFGHFGDLVRDVLPWVWARWQPGDVIGGNPLHRTLYPAAPDPRLWEPVAQQYPDGFDYRRRPDDLEVALRDVAGAIAPGADLIVWAPDGEAYPKPPIPLPEPYAIDVVVAPRAKPYTDAKNGWPWAYLVEEVRRRGYRVGIAGSAAESATIVADVAAWDLDEPGDSITGTLRLLRGARLVVTLDSGIAHLASLVDAPQLVIYDQRGDERRSLAVRDGVPTQMRFADVHRWNQRLCLPVWGGLDAVLFAIDEALSRLRVVPGDIDASKGRHVSAMPSWQPGESLVLTEECRSLIMRPIGNDLIETCPVDDAVESSPPRASDVDTQATRQHICDGCERWTAGRCGAAGCPCALLGRSDLVSSRCPLGKW